MIKHAKKTIAALSMALAIGCANSGDKDSIQISALESYPTALSGSSFSEVKPAFIGGLPEAVHFMKDGALKGLSEGAFVYLPGRRLLFDVSIYGQPGSVHRNTKIEDAIAEHYRTAGIKFHTHLDYYDSQIYGRLSKKLDEGMAQTKSRIGKCIAENVSMPDYFSKCHPTGFGMDIEKLDTMYYIAHDPEMAKAANAKDKVFLSYVPSIPDLMNHAYSPMRKAGQKAGVVIVGSGPGAAVMWYDAGADADLEWYNRQTVPYMSNRTGFTKRILEKLVSESGSHGISLQLEKVE